VIDSLLRDAAQASRTVPPVVQRAAVDLLMKAAPDVGVVSGLEHTRNGPDADLLDQDLGFGGAFRSQLSLPDLRGFARPPLRSYAALRTPWLLRLRLQAFAPDGGHHAPHGGN
jgi:hypothetical protein